MCKAIRHFANRTCDRSWDNCDNCWLRLLFLYPSRTTGMCAANNEWLCELHRLGCGCWAPTLFILFTCNNNNNEHIQLCMYLLFVRRQRWGYRARQIYTLEWVNSYEVSLDAHKHNIIRDDAVTVCESSDGAFLFSRCKTHHALCALCVDGQFYIDKHVLHIYLIYVYTWLWLNAAARPRNCGEGGFGWASLICSDQPPPFKFGVGLWS